MLGYVLTAAGALVVAVVIAWIVHAARQSGRWQRRPGKPPGPGH